MEENGSEHEKKKEEEDKEERWQRWRRRLNSQEEAGRPLQPLPQPRLRSGVCRAGRITHSDAAATVVLLHAAQEQQVAQNAAVRLLHPRL